MYPSIRCDYSKNILSINARMTFFYKTFSLTKNRKNAHSIQLLLELKNRDSCTEGCQNQSEKLAAVNESTIELMDEND
jgi:hypothetical protein